MSAYYPGVLTNQEYLPTEFDCIQCGVLYTVWSVIYSVECYSQTLLVSTPG